MRYALCTLLYAPRLAEYSSSSLYSSSTPHLIVLHIFSFFDYEDENDDEDDWNKHATRNPQPANSFLAFQKIRQDCFQLVLISAIKMICSVYHFKLSP